MSVGAVDLQALQYAGHPERRRVRPDHPIHETAHIERAARVLRSHPEYAAPDAVLQRIRQLIDSGQFRFFEA
jgi:hypothetical protein